MAVLPFEADLCSGVAPRLSAMFTSASFSSNATQMDFQFFDAAYCNAEWPSTVIAFTFAPSVSSVLTTFSRPADDARISGVMFVCKKNLDARSNVINKPLFDFVRGERERLAGRNERNESLATIMRHCVKLVLNYSRFAMRDSGFMNSIKTI